MRIAWTLVLPLALAGCSSNWQAYGVDTSCQKLPFFTDADGDGWGDPSDPGSLVCVGGPNTARNNRDCDDSADTGDTGAPLGANVTGRIGSLCPSQLVDMGLDTGGNAIPTQYAAVISGSEFVAVDGDTSLVWSEAGAEACGASGWGGHLATFADVNQLKSVLASLGKQQVYAGYVGFDPVSHTWGDYDSSGTWQTDTSAGTFQVPLCACVADGADQNTCANKYTSGLRYLALIRHRAGGSCTKDDWCLGTPDEAYPKASCDSSTDNGIEPAYQSLYGNFICSRPIPDPQKYALAQLPSADSGTP